MLECIQNTVYSIEHTGIGQIETAFNTDVYNK